MIHGTCEICEDVIDDSRGWICAADGLHGAHSSCIRATNQATRASVNDALTAERFDSQWVRELERRQQILTAMNTEETA